MTIHTPRGALAREPVGGGERLPDRVTIPALLRRGVQQWGDSALLVHTGEVRTWADVDRESAQLAKGLLALGVTKGSRIGLLLPNNADWVISFLAAARIGALVSPISTFLQGPELDRALSYADVQVLLCVDAFLSHDYLARLDRLPGMATQQDTELFLPQHPFLRRIVLWGNRSRPWALAGPAQLAELVATKPNLDDQLLAASEAAVEPADLLLTIWTSGTTSVPKGVVHSHGGALRYVHALRQIGRADVRRGERAYSAMPFFWLGGLNTVLFPSLVVGGVVVTTDAVTADAVLDVLVAAKVTRVAGWMGPVVELTRSASRRGIDVSGIRGLAVPARSDGTPIPAELRGNALGMTETFGPHSAESAAVELPKQKAGSMGRAVPGHERQIIDPDSGAVLPCGQVGELRVRGPGLMQGYYKRERSDCFDDEGYFRTGDQCLIDADGYLFFHGRRSELIKTAGANVSPREIEAALLADVHVAEAIVFGIPDELRGEAVVAVVVPVAGAEVDGERLKSQLQGQISHYKVPRQVIVVEPAAVPRTDSGKPRKAALRDALFGSAEG